MAGIVRSFWEGRDETANCYENRTINGDRSLGLERQKRATSAEPGLTYLDYQPTLGLAAMG